MKVLKEEVVEIFGQKMIVQLCEYERDVSSTTYPYDWRKPIIKKFKRLRFKNKFVEDLNRGLE